MDNHVESPVVLFSTYIHTQTYMYIKICKSYSLLICFIHKWGMTLSLGVCPASWMSRICLSACVSIWRCLGWKPVREEKKLLFPLMEKLGLGPRAVSVLKEFNSDLRLV